MFTRPRMYSPLLGNVEGKFYLRGNQSRTDRCSSIEVHLLNLSDGSPYCTPPSNIIEWAIESPDLLIKSIEGVIITNSRLMLRIRGSGASDPLGPWWISVWDWKTGNPVLVLQLGRTQFAHLISGAQPSILVWKFSPIQYGGRLP